MNENISEFNLFIICLVGSRKTVKGYINFGSANVFTTVILPFNVNFLRLQRFKQLLIHSILAEDYILACASSQKKSYAQCFG